MQNAAYQKHSASGRSTIPVKLVALGPLPTRRKPFTIDTNSDQWRQLLGVTPPAAGQPALAVWQPRVRHLCHKLSAIAPDRSQSCLAVLVATSSRAK